MGRLSGDSRSLSGVDPEQGRNSRADFDDMMTSVLAINSADVETPFLPADLHNGASSDEETASSMLTPEDTITSQGWGSSNKNFPRVLSKIVLEPPHLKGDSKEEPTKLLISHSDSEQASTSSSRSSNDSLPTPAVITPCSIATQVRVKLIYIALEHAAFICRCNSINQ